MTAVEIMALVVVVIAAIKIIVVLSNPRNWLAVVKAIYANPVLTALVALVLAIVSLGYLLKEVTIVQIFAVMLFLWFLMMLGFAMYSKDVVAWADKMLTKKMIKKSWLAIVIWVVLLVWALYGIFA